MSHIARNDPARVLADVEAKRRIVSHCDLLIRGSELASDIYDAGDADSGHTILRALASVYADHADFNEAWRVSPATPTDS